MDSLRAINEEQGITVITNLHTLDTARTYCERIIGMAQGRVVFDGTPDELTTDVARELYGAEGLAEAFSEAMTSTSLDDIAPRKEEEARLPASRRQLRRGPGRGLPQLARSPGARAPTTCGRGSDTRVSTGEIPCTLFALS